MRIGQWIASNNLAKGRTFVGRIGRFDGEDDAAADDAAAADDDDDDDDDDCDDDDDDDADVLSCIQPSMIASICQHFRLGGATASLEN